MILDFVDKNNIVRIIDLNQVVAITYNPDYGGEARVAFCLNGGHSVNFAPPEDMDMDLILASAGNCMKRKSNK